MYKFLPMVAVIFTVPAFFAVSLPSASTDTTLLFELFQTGATEAFNTTMDRLSPHTVYHTLPVFVKMSDCYNEFRLLSHTFPPQNHTE